MTNQQLFIGDKAVDMPNDMLKFKVESNLFSDASSIMTAHTYSISLPRTLTNDTIFRQAYVAASNTGGRTTHKYLECSLEIDGLRLFNKGKCVLTSIDDKGYKCNLYWGLLGIFDQIKEEGLNLCDLVMSKYLPANYDGYWQKLAEHQKYTFYNSGMNNTIYNTLSSDGKKEADYYPWSLQMHSATDMLTYICDVYNLTLDLSQTASERIAKLYHPLTTLKSLAKDELLMINLRGAWNYWQGDSRYHIGFMHPQMFDADTINYLSWGHTGAHSATNKWQANNAMFITDEPTIDPYCSHVWSRNKISVKKVRVYGTINTSFAFSVNVNGETATSHASGAGVQAIDHTWEEGFDVDEAGVPFIQLDPDDQSSTAVNPIDLNVEITIDEIGDIGKNMWWNNLRNYPQIGVIAYLNEILAHIGGVIVGTVNVPDKLRIVTFDEVAEKSAATYDMVGVKSIKMTLDKQAQKNNYLHKENDDVGLPYKADGVIYTNDTTLAIERKAFDSKFKVPRNTIIKLWEVEKNDGESTYSAKWKGGSDYITGWDNNAQVIRNTGQDFANTIANYYSHYEEIVQYPKVLEVTIRLSVLQLVALDLERPIYIKQLGRNYLIKSVETDSNDTYKLTLVQI